MDDEAILALFRQRQESALAETAAKYGRPCYRVADNILSDSRDAEECVNDTYKAAWEAMPPHRPSLLSTFLGKLTRRISIDRWRKQSADKRGGGETAVAFEELEECVSGSGSVEDEVERRELTRRINEFIKALPRTERQVFMCRYWYVDPVSDIAKQFGFSESKVKSMLFRTRCRLREMLEKEGY